MHYSVAYAKVLPNVSDNSTAKLLQTRTWSGSIVDLRGNDGNWTRQFVIGETINHLQRLHSQHISSYKVALRETSNLFNADNIPSDDGDRVAVVDAHPSCRGAEARLENELPPGFRSCVYLCEVHHVARAHRKTSICLSQTQTGMIRFAKCFAMAGEMADVRMALFEVAWIRSKHGFRVGSPPEEANMYRHQCARWYITGKGHWVRRVTLEMLPVGEWRGKVNVQI